MVFGPGVSIGSSIGRRNLRRWPLTGKHGNKNFYKGRGAPSAGHLTNKARFVLDFRKLERYLFKAPDLTGFELKAYVGTTTPKIAKRRFPPPIVHGVPAAESAAVSTAATDAPVS